MAETVPSVEQCAHNCNVTRTCVAFIFEVTEKYCMLKTGIGTWHQHEDRVTYVKDSADHQDIHATDTVASQEEVTITDELKALAKIPPLHPGKECFEACGNQSGWCSWCGIAKACCARQSLRSVCMHPTSAFMTFGHECVTPRNGQLNRLGIARFSFHLEGLDYAAVMIFEWLKEELIRSVKAGIVKLLLHAARVQQVDVTIHKLSRGWVEVRGTVMIPEGGPAAGYLAETRLCFSADSIATNLGTFVLQTPGINLAKRSDPEGDIKLNHFRLGTRACPQDVLLDFNSKSWIEFAHSDGIGGWTVLLIGVSLGCVAACCFLGMCHRYCRENDMSLKLPSSEKFIRRSSLSDCDISPQQEENEDGAQGGQLASSMTYIPAYQSQRLPAADIERIQLLRS